MNVIRSRAQNIYTEIINKVPLSCEDDKRIILEDGIHNKRSVPNVQPSTRRGIEPGTSRLAVRDLTNCANLAHIDSVGNLICMWHIRRSLPRGWGNLFMFGRGLDRIKGPCMWGIITVWFCLMANASYFPGVGAFTLTGALAQPCPGRVG